ncbi:MAG TPA: hypothetical protein DFR83_05515 [Deltaproteobacteria bacterium]|nr:hypothetical protein [Deltaproteobacteria bacterium]
MIASPSDRRTTPRWLRLPVLLLCGALAAYFGVAYTYALEKDLPDWLREHPWSLWLGTWQMFTHIDPSFTIVYADARVDGDWHSIELEALFPYQWESGPRYARTSFRRSQTRMRTLAQATCHRLRESDGIRAETVRFRAERNAKTKGASPQPKRRTKVQKLLEWDCSRSFPLPDGEVW